MSRFQFEPLTHESVLRHLHALGHFHEQFDGKADWSQVKKLTKRSKKYTAAVRSYQSFSSLKVDGKVGHFTNGSLKTGTDGEGNRRICQCPDIEPVTEDVNIPNGTHSWPFPEKPILFWVDFALPGLTKAEVRQCFEEAFRDINSKIGVRLQLGTKGIADVLVTKEHLGNDGTLALAMLASFTSNRRRINGHYQKYHSTRQWSMDTSAVSLIAVAIHECLHTLGFSHSRDKSSILYPSYRGSVLSMQPVDVKRMGKIYPPLPGTPDVPDNPDPPGDVPREIELRNLTGNVVIDGAFRPVIFNGTAKVLS